MVLRVALLFLLALSSLRADKKKAQESEGMRPNPAAAAPDPSVMASCPAGGPLGEVELTVKPASNGQPLPFINIVHLSEGDLVQYAPVSRGREKREGQVALVLVPARISGKEELMVTEIREAAKRQEWPISRTIALAVFVYGPQGLSKRRVKSFLSQDSSLLAEMADFADKTAQTEALLAALSNTESSPASMNAALTGFASQYGMSVQIDKSAAPGVQAQALFAAMNPQLANYSPLATTNASRTSQTASLATAAAGLLFGSPVGLLAGGTSMLLDLRAIAFPDTQFRSSFAQVTRNPRLNLCGERGTPPPRTRLAYIWASRIPNASTPTIQIGDAHFIPVSQKSPVMVNVTDTDWKYLQRARRWTLEDGTKQNFEVPLVKLQNQKAVELDLSKMTIPPGTYHLAGYWDWSRFQASGDVTVMPLSDFAAAQLRPDSQDKLLAKAGKIAVTVMGADFEFTTKVELKKAGDEFAVAEPVKFLLPKGPRLGPQSRMDVQIDTRELDPGRYQLLLSQADGKSYPLTFSILPNPPQVSNFPIVVNEGTATQHYVLKGERLGTLAKLEAAGVEFELGASSSGNSERNVTVRMRSALKPDTTLPVKAYLNDRSEPLTFDDALQITGPLPVIVSSKVSLPAGLIIKTRPDEFPAGSVLSAMLDVKNIDQSSSLQLGCAGSVGQASVLQIGHQTSTWDLQQISPDQLFVSFDTSALPAGCLLQVVIKSARQGESSPFQLARIIRVPQVESMTPAEEGGSGTTVPVQLVGKSLEMIEKAGWDPNSAVPPEGLPVPVPGEGQKQTLRLTLPANPNPEATIYVWLRGDKSGRETSIRLAAAGSGAQSGQMVNARHISKPALPANAPKPQTEPHRP